MLNNIKIVVLIVFATCIVKTSFGQKFADKKFYLVDSLDLNSLNNSDRKNIDSLLAEYHRLDDDSLKLDQLTVLISNCDNNIWVAYNDILKKQAENLIRKSNKSVYKKHLASAYNNYGYYYFQQDQLKNAIENFEKAVELSEQANHLEVIPTALNNIGYIYKTQGNILKALDYYHQSLKMNKKINDIQEVALCLNNIGGIYYAEKEYDKALQYYREALIIEKENGALQKGVGRLYSNIGAIYKEQKKYSVALEYFDQSIKIYREIEYERGLGVSLTKQAELELDMFKINEGEININEVISKLETAKQLFENNEDNEGLVFALYNLSEAHLLNNDVDKANFYGQKSLIISKKIGFPSSIKDAAYVLKNISELKKDFRTAYLMQQLYYEMQDSINNQSTKEGIIQKQYEYEYEKKSIRDSIVTHESQKVKDLKHQQEIERERTFVYAGAAGVGVMILLVIGIFRGYQIKKKNNIELEGKNKLIEEKNKEITDSITYAKRIQNAIIPPTEDLAKALKKVFVMFRPKDIVAGDFYWLQEIDGIVLYAAADCTGHGVPGAMVSVVCHNALNRAVREYGLREPAKILDKTRDIVIETLKNSHQESISIKDGMDIALCSVNFNSGELQYAGANNSLYIINPNRSVAVENAKIFGEKGEGFEIKADKQPVSNHFNNQPFTNHIIKLEKGDCIYSFSDGYPDQFGGERGKKFMYKKFKYLLIDIYHKPISQQLLELENTFDNWKGSMEQVDDICIIGVKI